MTRPAWKVIMMAFFMSGCNPVISGASLLHSITTNDGVSAVTSIMSRLAVTDPETKIKKKSRSEIMEDLRKAL